MTTHSSILAWRIPWAEEPSGLQFMGPKESDTTDWLHLFPGRCPRLALEAMRPGPAYLCVPLGPPGLLGGLPRVSKALGAEPG